jgi:hypothetical protein
MLVVSDSHNYKYAGWWPGDNGDWSRWESLVETVVKTCQEKGYKVQYDIWNEPCIGQFWPFGIKKKEGRDRWLETWRRAVRKIRSLDPQAVIVGPSNGGYDLNFFKIFLEYAKKHDVLCDIFSWHQMGLDLNFPKRAEAVRGLMKELGIKELPISINEYAGPSFQVSPGALVQFFSVFEQAKILSANKSCWGDPCGGNNCDNVSLNGLVTKPDNKRRSVWWAYKGYADITGTLVHVVRKGAIHGVAGLDNKRKRAGVILGIFQSRGAGPHIVRFTGMDTIPFVIQEGKVHVQASWIPDTEFKPLSRPIATLDTDYETDGKTLTVVIPYIGPKDAYSIMLTYPGKNKE